MIFIAGNVPSSKNSKEICWNKNMKRPILTNSKTVKNYLKAHEHEWKNPKTIKEFKKKLEGKEKPYRIGFYFIRDSRRKFDFINAAQLPCDLMARHGWIDDDNANEIVPVFLGYETDKENAGVGIEVL
ncbi:hypothetical protein [Fusobacterium necrophorum]|nr:hypothetical protein [Fusobacterium necrophorum]MDK4479942.1 hypothetical protein [Fusobacterium necrophorum]